VRKGVKGKGLFGLLSFWKWIKYPLRFGFTLKEIPFIETEEETLDVLFVFQSGSLDTPITPFSPLVVAGGFRWGQLWGKTFCLWIRCPCRRTTTVRWKTPLRSQTFDQWGRRGRGFPLWIKSRQKMSAKKKQSGPHCWLGGARLLFSRATGCGSVRLWVAFEKKRKGPKMAHNIYLTLILQKDHLTNNYQHPIIIHPNHSSLNNG